MKGVFIATLGLGMILNVPAASAQGYPFGTDDNTDQPWSVNQQYQDGLASVVEEAVAFHRMVSTGGESTVPTDSSTNAELASWLARELGHSVAPPDLSQFGFRLVGGRLVSTAQGPGGLYLYGGGNGLRLTLFMRPMKKRNLNAPMRPMYRIDAVGYVWASDGLGFGVVSSRSMNTLHGLANEIRDDMSVKER